MSRRFVQKTNRSSGHPVNRPTALPGRYPAPARDEFAAAGVGLATRDEQGNCQKRKNKQSQHGGYPNAEPLFRKATCGATGCFWSTQVQRETAVVASFTPD